MTLYAVRQSIRYDFARPTGAGRQLFRILPANIVGLQTVREAGYAFSPDAGERGEFQDFFGTRVIEAAMPPGLISLDLTMHCLVERRAEDALLDLSPHLPGLVAELAAHRSVGPRAPHHFTLPSRRIPVATQISEFARDQLSLGLTIRALVEKMGRALHDHMTFDAKATRVDTPPEQAFAQGRGVCQDFAQIMVGALRAVGVPSAYVAGYLRTLPPPGKPRLVGADAMHAWVRAWAGEEMGWVDYDPTNACYARNDHIDVGFGRDYDDVAPVTGRLRLDGDQSGSHSVDIEEIPA
ncbi:MAG: transglutaminase family protein [Pseudotabrizicola sp.]|uniref:transglutaminase family protein n=1 Tax=Pseudotabrizicola sp. TaxID=2939647 RepID=UPI002715C9EB|nr:transglutaminase family protein [Pseudotabrizicola sp.]MDO8881383.1 transglutaminase family protein [Pseudotabrizicola sp.]MDP2081802.1 transglutaminase family protein [Pseudotabrizicola sp.]MDZ7573908.1 transglutaminase family protein [Pseudotabrizicola sp.]